MAKKRKLKSEPDNHASLMELRDLFVTGVGTEQLSSPDSALQVNPLSDVVKLGLPIPFPMEYILGCDVLQTGVVVEANGPPASCKTMLLFECGRWFIENGGIFDMVVTEQKLSEELAYSVIGHDYSKRRNFMPWTASSLENMCQLVQDSMARVNAFAKMKHPSTGKLIGHSMPLLVGIDSIMGAIAEETKAKIKADGAPSRGFAIEALLLNSFMKDMAADIHNKPFLLFLINHRKEGKQDPTNTWKPRDFTKPGGKQIQFQDTYELVLHACSGKSHKRVDRAVNSGLDINGRTITIENGKNSAGQDRRVIDVDVTFRNRIVQMEGPDGMYAASKQITKFDWDTSTTRLLWGVYEGKDGRFGVEELKIRKAKLEEVLQIRRGTKGGEHFWSSTLGITESDHVSARAFGRLVSQNPDVLEALRLIFSITKGKVWVPGRDFSQHRFELTKQFAAFNQSQRQKGVADVLTGLGDIVDE